MSFYMQTPTLFFSCDSVNSLIRLLRWKGKMLLLGKIHFWLPWASSLFLFQLFSELLCKWQKGSESRRCENCYEIIFCLRFYLQRIQTPLSLSICEWIEKFITLRLQNATRMRTCDALEFSGNGNGINVILLCQCLGFQWLLIIHSCARGREDMRSV